MVDELENALRSRVPPVMPPVRAVLLGFDGAIGVVLTGDTSTRCLLLGENGVTLGTMELPPKSRIEALSRTHIWALEFDADDIPSVVTYRLGPTRQ